MVQWSLAELPAKQFRTQGVNVDEDSSRVRLHHPDIIFVNKFTRPEFLGLKFYLLTRILHDRRSH